MTGGTEERNITGDLSDAVSRGDTGYLIEALKSPDYAVRAAAANGLGEVGGAKAALVLLSLARDRWGERPDVRIAALRSLGSVHEAPRYASILQEFITGDNRKVMAAARKMLQALDPDGFARRLVESGAVDHAAIRAYGAGAEPSAAPLLRRYLAEREAAGDAARSTSWGKVYAAVNALGSIGGQDAVQALEALLSHLEEAERSETGALAGNRVTKMLAATRASLERLGKV